MTEPVTWEVASLSDLKPHPRNYRAHPEEQLKHIRASLEEHGLYRNIVVAHDGTILAGHGVVKAALSLGWTEAKVCRLAVSPSSPVALKVLTGDNEMGRLAEVDDRLLSELLKEVHDFEGSDLLGTGFDQQILANLLMVTRDAGEIEDMSAAAEWVGMPEFEPEELALKVTVNVKTEEDKTKLLALLGAKNPTRVWWPPKERNDLASVKFEAEDLV